MNLHIFYINFHIKIKITLLIQFNDEQHPTNISSSTTNSSAAIEKPKSSVSRPSKGAFVINNFLNKCGVASTSIQKISSTKLTIERELAKLASLQKDDYEFNCFWQEHSKNLPELSFFAKKYLSICSSSVASESAFSTSSYILRKNRLCLSSKNLKQTMFLRDKI